MRKRETGSERVRQIQIERERGGGGVEEASAYRGGLWSSATAAAAAAVKIGEKENNDGLKD